MLRRNWHTLALINVKREQRLPVVFTREEVRRLLGAVRTAHKQSFFAAVYACGLRVGTTTTFLHKPHASPG